MGTINAENPGDLLAMTSYVLGYTPTDSLVIIGLQEQSTGLHLRVDLTGAKAAPTELIGEYVPIFAREHKAVLILMFTAEAPSADNHDEANLAALLAATLDYYDIDVPGAWQFGGGYARPLDCTDADCCPYPGVRPLATSETAKKLAPATEVTPADTLAAFKDAPADPQVAAEVAGHDATAEVGLATWDAAISGELSTDQLTPAEVAAMLATLTDPGSRALMVTAAAGLATGYSAMQHPTAELPRAAQPTGDAPDWTRIDALADALAVVTPYADRIAAANAYAVMGWIFYVKGQATPSSLFLAQGRRFNRDNQLAGAVATAMQTPSQWAQASATAYYQRPAQ